MEPQASPPSTSKPSPARFPVCEIKVHAFAFVPFNVTLFPVIAVVVAKRVPVIISEAFALSVVELRLIKVPESTASSKSPSVRELMVGSPDKFKPLPSRFRYA